MDPVVGVLALAALPIAMVVSALQGQARRAALAERLGLTPTQGGATGRVAGFEVRLEGRGPFRVRLHLDPEHAKIKLQAATLLTLGIETGDAQFDASVSVEGPPLRLLAALDLPTRALTRRLVAQGVQIRKGVFEVNLDGDPEAALARVNDLVAVAQRLRHPHPCAQLLEALQLEALPGVARRAVEVLEALTPAEEAPLRIHPQPEVRLELALAMRPPATDVVASMVTNASNSLEFRQRALTWLGRLGPTHAVAAARAVLAEQAARPLVVAALDVLTLAQVCPPLSELPPGEDTALALGRARCLKFSKEPAEAHLLELLAHAEPLVAEAAADALAIHGTQAAVGPLRARAGWGGSLRATVQATVAAIQGRVGVPAGALSVQANEVGGLAVAERPGET